MANSTGQTPQIEVKRCVVAALALTVDATVAVMLAPFAGTIGGISYVPAANVTGDDTDNRTLTVINKGQAGSGTTELASLLLETGTDLVAFDENEIPLSEAEGALTVAEGDVISFGSVHAGSTGLVDPGGLVLVTFNRA